MKNIIICCDGTGNEFGRNNTNVVLTYMLAEKDEEQVVYYDPGVGTGGWEYEEDGAGLRAKGDQATGRGLQKNVEDAYRYLMARYVPDDRVYLFGFSRGAFTVRSLAGMLHKCGLLRADAGNFVEYAGKMYNSSDRDAVARDFRTVFGTPCPIHFVGVWDTVDSLVMNAGKRFHDASLNEEVSNGFHALAIDEVRRDFPPSLWDATAVTGGQTMEQVWFAGVHADVGGWYDERGLSNVALHWMLGKARACGFRVDQGGLDRFAPDPHGPAHQSYDGFWRIRGRRTRSIPAGAKIHSSVVERMQRSGNDYRPANLPKEYATVD